MNKIQRRFAYSRVPQPLREWFKSTFNNADPNNPVLVLYLFNIVKKSSEGVSYSIGHRFLKDHFTDNSKAATFTIELCRCLNIEIPFFSENLGIERKILLNRDFASNVYKQWLDNLDLSRIKQKDPLKEMMSEIIKPLNTNYKKIIKHLNEESMNITYPFQFNKAIETAESGDETPLREAKLTHTHIGAFYYENKGRVWINQYSLQNIKSKYRSTIMPRELGFYELDLKSAHPAILSHCLGLDNLKAVVSNFDLDYRQEIANKIGTTKDAVKLAITTICYGAKKTQIEACLIPFQNSNKDSQVYKDKEDVQKLLNSKEWNQAQCILKAYNTDEIYNKLMQIDYIRDLKEGVSNFNPTKSAFGDPLPEYKKQSTRVSHFCNTWEKKLLMPIYDECIKNERISVVLDQHDGMTIYCLDVGLVNDVIDKTNINIQKLGIPTRVEIK